VVDSLNGGEPVPRFDRLEFEQSPDQPQQPGAAAETLRDEQYWLRLADAERRQGNYENALRFYSRALERDKSLVEGWLGQVQMLIALEEYPEADIWARKALELFRQHSELLAARAQALSRKGDRKKAQELCDAALAQAGHSAYRWLVRGELMVAGKQEIDRYCFDKASQIDPDWLVNLEAGLVYVFYSQPAKALTRIRQAVEKAPDSAHAWYQQGCCEDELGLTKRAQASFRRCLELAPGHVEAERQIVKVTNRGWSLKRGLRRLATFFKGSAGLFLLKRVTSVLNVPSLRG
jgi:tetratricopeptide (TPR) repeat protein